MPLDIDSLEAAPDLTDFDASKLDRGDAPIAGDTTKEVPLTKVADEVVAPAKTAEEIAAEALAAGDQTRDEKGRFAAADGKGEVKIPKERFDEAVGKERQAREAAERRADVAENQLREREKGALHSVKLEEMEASIVALETQHAQLLLDGKAEDATKVMREIRLAERKIATTEAELRVTERVEHTLERERISAAVARLEADHAILNPKSEDYDEDLVDFIVSKQQALMKRDGMTPSAALDAAAKEVMARFATPKTAAKTAEEIAAEAEAAKGLDAAQGVKDRKQAQVEKNLDTVAKQPASLKVTGIDSDKLGQTGPLPKAEDMNFDEFTALPKATVSRMRGDML